MLSEVLLGPCIFRHHVNYSALDFLGASFKTCPYHSSSIFFWVGGRLTEEVWLAELEVLRSRAAGDA